MNGKTRPILAIMAAASLWGFIGWFSYVLMFYGFSPVQVTAVRTIAGAVFMTALLLLRSPQLLKIIPRDIWMFIGTGIFSVLFFNLFYLLTFTFSSLSVAVMLLYTAPAFVMLLSVLLFKERLTKGKLLALASTILGCLFLSGILSGGWQCPPEAFLTGILSGFGYALYSIFSKYALKKYNSATISVWTFYLASLPLLPFCQPDVMLSCFIYIPDTALAAAGISILCTVMPYLLYTYGLKYVDAGHASILAMLEPVVGCLIGLTALGENFTSAKAAGLFFILAAIVILNSGSIFKRGTEK